MDWGERGSEASTVGDRNPSDRNSLLSTRRRGLHEEMCMQGIGISNETGSEYEYEQIKERSIRHIGMTPCVLKGTQEETAEL